MSIKLFESKQIRSVWNEVEQQWYFSVVDIIEILTDSINPTDYLKKMRKRDVDLGNYIGTNCPQIAMTSQGKTRKTLSAIVKPFYASFNLFHRQKPNLLNFG